MVHHEGQEATGRSGSFCFDEGTAHRLGVGVVDALQCRVDEAPFAAVHAIPRKRRCRRTVAERFERGNEVDVGQRRVVGRALLRSDHPPDGTHNLVELDASKRQQLRLERAKALDLRLGDHAPGRERPPEQLRAGRVVAGAGRHEAGGSGPVKGEESVQGEGEDVGELVDELLATHRDEQSVAAVELLRFEVLDDGGCDRCRCVVVVGRGQLPDRECDDVRAQE